MSRQALPTGLTVETNKAIVAKVGRKNCTFGRGAKGLVVACRGLGNGMRKVRFHLRGRPIQDALVHVDNLVTNNFY